MRLNSLRILEFSLSVESGMPVSFDRFFSRLVREYLFDEILVRIRSCLSLRVLKSSLRRSSTPLFDIGG